MCAVGPISHSSSLASAVSTHPARAKAGGLSWWLARAQIRGAMAGYNDVYAAKVIDMVATAGVTVSVNAHINLVCSARIDREPRRRGIAML